MNDKQTIQFLLGYIMGLAIFCGKKKQAKDDLAEILKKHAPQLLDVEESE